MYLKNYESLVKPMAYGEFRILREFSQFRIKQVGISSVEENMLLILPCAVIWDGTFFDKAKTGVFQLWIHLKASLQKVSTTGLSAVREVGKGE